MVFDLSTIPYDGMVIRERDRVRILVKKITDRDLLTDSRVLCLNPEAALQHRVYEIVFVHRQIYLASERERAIHQHLHNEVQPVVVLGGNGLTKISDEDLEHWHVHPDGYRVGAEQIFLTSHLRMKQELGDGVDIRFIHGCSTRMMARRGIDTAIINTAKKLRAQMLGFSCPRFMLYVTDETDFPILLASNEAEYSKWFVQALDVLITCNGRATTREKDVRVAIMERKLVILYDLLGRISSTGGPPAYGPNGEVRDAVKALMEGIKMIGSRRIMSQSSGDPWKDDLHEIACAIVERVRTRKDMPPEVALHVNLTKP